MAALTSSEIAAIKADAAACYARNAVSKLREARDFLVLAGAGRAADKVRAALKSAEGAVRHAERKIGG